MKKQLFHHCFRYFRCCSCYFGVSGIVIVVAAVIVVVAILGVVVAILDTVVAILPVVVATFTVVVLVVIFCCLNFRRYLWKRFIFAMYKLALYLPFTTIDLVNAYKQIAEEKHALEDTVKALSKNEKKDDSQFKSFFQKSKELVTKR